MEVQSKRLNNQIEKVFRQGDIVVKLLLLNCFVFVLEHLLFSLDYLLKLDGLPIHNTIANWFYLSPNVLNLLVKPYTLLSYQFFHDNILHLIINSILLFFFGKLLVKDKGASVFLPLYIFAGIYCGLIFTVSNYLPGFNTSSLPIVGASGDIMAIIGASLVIMPNLPVNFFFLTKFKLKWIVLFIAAIHILSLIYTNQSHGTHIVHLTGLAFGYIYMLLYSKGIDIGAPFYNMLLKLKKLLKKNNSKKLMPSSNAVNSIGSVDQDTLDNILDKINISGYKSLTQEEKAFLYKASNNL